MSYGYSFRAELKNAIFIKENWITPTKRIISIGQQIQRPTNQKDALEIKMKIRVGHFIHCETEIQA